YTADEYRQLCSLLRNSFEDASITTDVMVGFHEETEEDFYNSLNFVKEIGFEKVHVFPYSQREGTNASKKGDSVSKKEKEHRAEIMINETEKIRKEYFHSLINKTVCVLFENEIEKGIYQGYTKNYTPVRLSSDTNIIGKEMDVVITDTADEYCISTLQP
ncbi:MAG: tRNA (N(6)-L-threonylcarbamoyladenosine(37)-C(2))-methylthiotransferase MtaB, partial [Eubacterium sp.]|nr:tRNA (N(6)-L-threonylcarbamoyladenosine(37)-C(2))-methylthiotransferase MtaB [Eubacterium sp.]